jgi:hypothetical protein
MGASGRVTGTARVGSVAVAGSVDIGVGAATARAAVDPRRRHVHRHAGTGGRGAARGLLRWTSATPAAVVTTTTAFGRAAPGGNPTPAPPRHVAGARRRARLSRRRRPGRRPPHAAGRRHARAPACATTAQRSGSRRTFRGSGVPPAGSSAAWPPLVALVDAAPLSGRLELRLTAGRASGFTLGGTAWRSAPDGARVGTSKAHGGAAIGRLSGWAAPACRPAPGPARATPTSGVVLPRPGDAHRRRHRALRELDATGRG